jgi:hypothetical protein
VRGLRDNKMRVYGLKKGLKDKKVSKYFGSEKKVINFAAPKI